MKLRCPVCGAEIKLNEASQAAELQALDKAAAAFGDDWPLVTEYLDCFRSAGGDAGATKMKVTKRLRLARELWEMWKDGRFSIGGVWYRIGREEFRGALRTTCNQVSPGLTNHNYLKRVLVAAAEKTSQREEQQLREKEDGLRSPSPRPSPARGEGEEEVPEDPAARAEFLRQIRMAAREKTEEQRKYQAQLNILNQAVRRARRPCPAQEAAKAALEQFMKRSGKDAQRN